MKAGQGVPVKFDLADGLGLDVLFGTPICDAVPMRGRRGLGRRRGDDQRLKRPSVRSGHGLYTYVWKTDKAWANQCRTFEITFDDGAYRQALFNFTK